MADHNLQTALSLLRSWRTILTGEAQAVSQGDIDALGVLINKALTIQQRLDHIFDTSGPLRKDGHIANLIEEIIQQQGDIVKQLKGQTDELAQEISTLRKNKTSLQGYKQNRAASARFMNEKM